MVRVRDELPHTPGGNIDFPSWKTKYLQVATEDFIAPFNKACSLLEHVAANVPMTIQEPLLHKALVMSEIVHSLGLDPETVIAALLYPFVDAKLISKEIILNVFHPKLLKLIEGTSLIEASRALGRTFSDKLRRLLLAVVEDVRVVLIKLAERLYSVRFSKHLNTTERKNLAVELRDIYAPLANRLGIGQIKWEMEDLAFRILEPQGYKQIASLLDEKRIDREQYIQTVVATIKKALADMHLHAEVVGRPKHIFSIWRKMNRKGLDFKDIYDVRAVRILVKNIPDCYAALGVVHTLWQHIPKEFDDYVATPKANGYRSLHTAVVGPRGKNIEIQIRTFDMHQEAELGVAAHWIYKEGTKQDPSYQNKITALRQLLEWQEEVKSQVSDEESLRLEVFEDRVYVFSPKGEVVDLPQGATPLDFAYHVHTELGHRCRGAKVNHAIVPLSYTLHSGDQVEILAAKTGAPSRDWLNPHLGYLRSARARAKVLQWFKKQTREQNREEGRALLERELKRLGLGQPDLTKLATKLQFKSTDDLFVALGSGYLRPIQVLQTLEQWHSCAPRVPSALPIGTAKPKEKHKTNVVIHGIGHLMSQFAKCCKPLPGDPIVGYITLGRGVTIHRQDCLQALQFEEQEEKGSRLIQVAWGDAGSFSVYSVDIMIKAYDRQGLLRDITAILSQEKVNVTAVRTHTDVKDNLARMHLTIEVADLGMLERVLTRIQQLPNVLVVQRVHSG